MHVKWTALVERWASAGCCALLCEEADVRGSPAWKALCSGDGEWGEKKQALLEITTKGRDGGRVELAWLCLESNKTRRLRGAGSILWELWLIPGNWTETYTGREYQITNCGVPLSENICLFETHFSEVSCLLRVGPQIELVFIKVVDLQC